MPCGFKSRAQQAAVMAKLRNGKLVSMRKKTTVNPQVPKVISHRNMRPLLEQLVREPYFQPGPASEGIPPPKWVYQTVVLEFPSGELAESGLKTMALIGREPYETAPLTGKEGFTAQGLEGKVRVRVPLFNALINLRDTLPKFRGRIITRED